MNYLTCILIVGLIIIVFFIGYGVGIMTPFLLKKYFNISESNLNQLNNFKDEFSNDLNSLREDIKNLDVINDVNQLKAQMDSLLKARNDNKELINEWLYGDKNGGGINGTS